MLPSILRSAKLAALPCFLLWTGGPASVRAQESQSFPINEDNGSSAEVTHVLSAVPPGGYTAVRVTVTNKGKEEISVLVGTESTTPAGNGEHSLSGPPTAIACEAESTTTREIIVPLMTDFTTHRSYQDTSLAVNFTVAGRVYNATFHSNKTDNMPFWGISQSIGGASATALNEAAQKGSASSTPSYGGREKFAGSFLPEHLPSDWRAYTGLDGLALTPEEWNTLQPGVRTAIRQWIMLGGVLDFYGKGEVPEGILQEIRAGAPALRRHPLGLGFVRPVYWNAKVLEGDQYGGFQLGPDFDHRQRAARTALEKGSTVNPGASLPQALGVRSFAAWQVGVILLLFGILVGPVNLFYLAGPGRRHRLFVTTPLIALGASLVLIAVIFLQDGAGGKGQRAALLELFPDENLSTVRQYQISRTGVLFGGGFVMEELALLTPLLLEDSRWTRLKSGGRSDSEGQRFNQPEPQAYAGDWFQSRSEQAQLVETIRPGRGRLELKPGAGDPVLVSSLAGALESVFYQDSGGQWWTAPAPLATGGSLSLQPSDAAAFAVWSAEQLAPFPMAVAAPLRSARHAGRFYAISRDPAIGFAGTLKSIDWANDHAFLHGRLAPIP